jgi:hypothetical protein
MRANFNNRLSLGAFFQGQGRENVVELAQRSLRALAALVLASKSTRGLYLRPGLWQALFLKRWPLAAAAIRPLAMCSICSDHRRQRHQRCLPGVVVTRGTVGVC